MAQQQYELEATRQYGFEAGVKEEAEQVEAMDPTKTDAPKGTALILGLYALLIGILWGLMYFDLILRR